MKAKRLSAYVSLSEGVFARETLVWASVRSYTSSALPTSARVARFSEFGRAEKVLKYVAEEALAQMLKLSSP